MVAVAVNFVRLGMSGVTSNELTNQINGSVTLKRRERLMGVGIADREANEIVAQITAGIGNSRRLMGVGVPARLAAAIAAAIVPVFVATGLPIWQAAMRSFIAGGPAPTVVFDGDSTSAGLGGAGNGLVGAKPFSVPYKFAQKLATLGYPAQNDSILGNAITGTMAGLIAYDSRISTSGPTTDWGNTNATLGGQILTEVSGGGRLIFAPSFGTDTVDIWTPNVAAATANVYVNGGGTPIGSIVMTNGGSTLTKSTFTFPQGTNTIEIQSTSNTYWMASMMAYSSVVRRVKVLSGSRPSGTTTDAALATTGFAARNALTAYTPKLTFIWLGENDAATSIPLSTSMTNYQNIYNAAVAGGSDVVAVVPLSVQTPTAFEQPLRDAIIAFAATNNIPLYNTLTGVELGSWAAANAAGLMFDQGHFNGLGYDNMATALLNVATT